MVSWEGVASAIVYYLVFASVTLDQSSLLSCTSSAGVAVGLLTLLVLLSCVVNGEIVLGMDE